MLTSVCNADVDERSTTVGLPAQIDDLVLPGPKLEVKPQEDLDYPFVLRIVEVYPHGGSFRYDLEYYGLEPGEYDVAEHLQPEGAAEAVELPSIEVSVEPILPPGQIVPNELEAGKPPRFANYRLLATLAVVAWLAAGFAIFFVGRKRPTSGAEDEAAKPRTLADRLRPTVEAAVAGKLSEKELAELERTLFAFWRERLNLNDVPSVEAMRKLLEHPKAGQLLRQLEVWLHQPGPTKDVDVAALLAPYRDLPADALSRQQREAATA